jgi:hypothetical protein
MREIRGVRGPVSSECKSLPGAKSPPRPSRFQRPSHFQRPSLPSAKVPSAKTLEPSLFRQSHHECTLSHRSPRGRRSGGFNQHAGIRASIQLALHHHAGSCLARNTGVDRHSRLAGGQGFQPLVRQPASRSLGLPFGSSALSSTLTAQSGLGVCCAAAWIASQRSVSLASCS